MALWDWAHGAVARGARRRGTHLARTRVRVDDAGRRTQPAWPPGWPAKPLYHDALEATEMTCCAADSNSRRISKQYPAVKRQRRRRRWRCCRARSTPSSARTAPARRTLMKIIVRRGAARRRHDRDRRPAGRRSASPARARARSASAMVFQHFALFDTLTVGREHRARRSTGAPARRASTRAHPRSVASATACRSTRRRTVHDLSVGERQRVEILRALLAQPAAADPRRADLGADAAGGRTPVRDAAPAGRRGRAASSSSATSSTRSARCATRCTVMRGGRVVGGRRSARARPKQSLARLMIGAEPPQIAAHDTAAGRGRAARSKASRCRRRRRHGCTTVAFDRARAARSSASPACPATASRS
ncbi:MAG: ATP-binding cassette domain-containing protein [Comamonadaceae bacterium]|nr:ATP-binding cassette domain-containing protein [Comamonadaceae bacterium]